MSTSTIKHVWPGEWPGMRIEDGPELSNSWGTGAMVWCFMCERHLQRQQTAWMMGTDVGLWGLWKDLEIPEHDRAVFLFTLDRLYVKRENFERFACDIEKWLANWTGWGKAANHWPGIVDYLRFLLKDESSEVPAIGLRVTSLASDSWGIKDLSAPAEIYAELDGLK